MDDEDLQDEPLQITVLDHDTYSANDAIGKVYIDIDPLLYSEAATVISGWFPIYDTIHGKKRILRKAVIAFEIYGILGTILCIRKHLLYACLYD